MQGRRFGQGLRAAWFSAVLAASTGMIVAVGPGTAGAEPASFAPIESTAAGPQSAFGRVVTDGSGTFHSVARENAISQHIAYRRSTDGGENWVVLGRFIGDAGGATRPTIAVDGDRVAIAYIGGWNDPSIGVVAEVPYLVLSSDSGRSWAAPMRLDRRASVIRVAVDDDRVWVAWERGSNVELRGFGPGGRTPFATEQYTGSSPQIAAADSKMVLAFTRWAAAGLGVDAVTADGGIVGAARPLPKADSTSWLRLASWDQSVASADGNAYVLTSESPPPGGETESPVVLGVSTARGAGGSFGPATEVTASGYSAAIAATSGTVAVAVADRDGTTRVATSGDGAARFTAAVPVSTTPGREPLVAVGIRTIPPGRPVATFDWSVPDRYVDADADGLPEPVNLGRNPTLEQLAVYTNQVLRVRMDACGSTPGSGRTITSYVWSVDGDAREFTDQCTAELELDDGVAVTVNLRIGLDNGTSVETERTVTPNDFLVVSIGDSVASGEGSPNVPGLVPRWTDAPCHRSALAGPALAARRLEVADRRSSVTFVQLACSGAAIVDQPEVAGLDDPSTGGLLDGYEGVAPAAGSLRPSQLAQMAEWVGARPIDALTVSIGANDVQFSAVIEACLLERSCNTSPTRSAFEARLAQLPARYSRLADALVAAGVDPAAVHLTEYFDAVSDDVDAANLRCVLEPGERARMESFSTIAAVAKLLVASSSGAILSDDEAMWARTGVMNGINAAGSAASAAHGWRYVGGIAQQFRRHGYCATDNWVERIGESLLGQRGLDGAFHPTSTGQRVYGNALFADLATSLLVPKPTTTGSTSEDPRSLGDVMVMTASTTTVTSAAVTLTGGNPEPGAVRVIDRLVAGEGLVAPGGPPAVDGTVAVGSWHELSGQGASDTLVRFGRLGARLNLAARSARIVQAPADALVAVAGRPALVQATIDASIASAETLGVTTRVVATDAAGNETELIPATTEQITFRPGRNVVLLPRGVTFAANEGDLISATVEVSDPPGARPDAIGDNAVSVTPDAAPSAVATRPLDVLVTRAGLGGRTVSCEDITGIAERMSKFAGVAMPVDAGGVTAQVGCGLQLPAVQDEPGVLRALSALDELARYTGHDAIVMVVPDGWLRAASKKAVGAAVPGMRAVILESTSPTMTLAHELAHIYGVDHTKGEVDAFGARVDRRENRAGIDWMNERTVDKYWTGGAKWDALALAIGGPDRTPQPLDPNGSGIWVRGTVSRNPDGEWVITQGEWLPDGPGPATDPIDPDLEDLQVERLTATQLDQSGNPLGDPTPVALAGAGGVYAPGATPPAEPFGYGYATRLEVDPATRAIAMTLDGAVVDTVTIGAAPTVAVDAPLAGMRIARGEDLTVAWTASDPDGGALTAAVLISDDDGATWRPLAADVDGTSLTVPVPQDVGGEEVRVRVIVSDGTRQASADSERFAAEPDPTSGEERVVFVRRAKATATDVVDFSRSRLWTMRPDGSDVREVALPATTTYPPDFDGRDLCTFARDCSIDYRNPSWGPDGRIYFSSQLMAPSFDGPNPFAYEPGERIWSSEPDGSDLQRITAPPSDASYWGTERFGVSRGGGSTCPTVSPDGQSLAWLGTGAGKLWIARRNATGWDRPTLILQSGSQPGLILPPSFPVADPSTLRFDFSAELGSRACPDWSPDSSFLLLLGGSVSFGSSPEATRFDTSPIARVAADGSSIAIVSPLRTVVPATGGYAGQERQVDFNMSASWDRDGRIVVVRGFTDLTAYDPSSAVLPGPDTFGVFLLDPATSTFARVTPEPDTRRAQRPDELRVAPDGSLYGPVSDGPFDCFNVRWTMGVVDRGTGAVQRVVPESTVGPCPNVDVQFDWAVVAGPSGSNPPRVQVDPDAELDDGNRPEDVDVLDVAAPGEPLVGADDVPAGPVPVPAAGEPFRIPAGMPTPIVLSTVDGTRAAFRIAIPPPSGELSLAAPTPTPMEATTGLDGTVIVTPAPGFVGRSTFTFAVAAAPQVTATATIDVVEPPAPVAAPDRLDVVVGVEQVVEPSVLVGNDQAPVELRLAQPLRLASVFGTTNGQAWIDVDGQVRVLAERAGTYRFSYLVASSAGRTSVGEVTVVASAVVPPTTVAPTTVAPTTVAPTTVPPTTAPSTTVAPTTVPPTTAPPGSSLPPVTSTVPPSTPTTSTSPTTSIPEDGVSTPTTSVPGSGAPVSTLPTPIGALPATGSDRRVAEWATLAILAGVLAVGVSRRRGSVRCR